MKVPSKEQFETNWENYFVWDFKPWYWRMFHCCLCCKRGLFLWQAYCKSHVEEVRND